MCKCKWIGAVLSIIVIVIALWMPFGLAADKWILAIAGFVLLVISLGCNDSKCGMSMASAPKKTKVSKARRR